MQVANILDDFISNFTYMFCKWNKETFKRYFLKSYFKESKDSFEAAAASRRSTYNPHSMFLPYKYLYQIPFALSGQNMNKLNTVQM